MPAVSKQQQAFMGMVDQYKKTGKLPDYNENMKEKIRKAADSMTKKQVHDFAATDTKKLPEKKAEYVFNKLSAVHVLSPEESLEQRKIRAAHILLHKTTPAIVGGSVLGAMVGAAGGIGGPAKRVARMAGEGALLGGSLFGVAKHLSNEKAKKTLNPANDEIELTKIRNKRNEVVKSLQEANVDVQ